MEYAECKTWITDDVCVILEIDTISYNLFDIHKVWKDFYFSIHMWYIAWGWCVILDRIA